MAHMRLIQQFRSDHSDLFPAHTPNRPEEEFLDQCAVIFQCTACGSVFHFKDAVSHGAECAQSSPTSWSIGYLAPAQHNTVAIVLSLLEVLELPQDTTMSSATEVLDGVRFVCLCGDPRYGGNFDFQGLVSIPSFVVIPKAESVLCEKLDHVLSENQEYEEIKSKILGKRRSRTTSTSASSDVQLINDHDRYALATKILRIDREELGYGDAAVASPTRTQRIPTRRKWDHCDICLQLTGTKFYFGGSLEFKRYHLDAKWVE